MILSRFYHTHKRRIWLSAEIVAALFTVLAIVYAIRGVRYTAVLRIFTSPPAGIIQEYVTGGDSGRLDTLLTLASSQTVLQNVIRKLDLKMTVPELESVVSIRQESGTGILRIQVTAKDPREAKVIVQTLGEEFLAYIGELNKQEIKTTRTFLEERLDQAKKEWLEAKTKLRDCKVRLQAKPPTPEQEIQLTELTVNCNMRKQRFVELLYKTEIIRDQEKNQNRWGNLTLMGPPQVYKGYRGTLR